MTSLLMLVIAAVLAASVAAERARRRGAFLFSRDILLAPRGDGDGYMFFPLIDDTVKCLLLTHKGLYALLWHPGFHVRGTVITDNASSRVRCLR